MAGWREPGAWSLEPGNLGFGIIQAGFYRTASHRLTWFVAATISSVLGQGEVRPAGSVALLGKSLEDAVGTYS